nr:translation initiation factor IF-2-like [Rattus norvegicus]
MARRLHLRPAGGKLKNTCEKKKKTGSGTERRDTLDKGRREPSIRQRPSNGRASRALGPGPHGRPEGDRDTAPRPPPLEGPATGGGPLSLREHQVEGGNGNPSCGRPMGSRATPSPGVFKLLSRNRTARYPDRSGVDTRGPEGGSGCESPPVAQAPPACDGDTPAPSERESCGRGAAGAVRRGSGSRPPCTAPPTPPPVHTR